MTTRRSFLATVAAGATFPALFSHPSFAQKAARTGRIVVGLPPGGGTDVAARIIADRLRTRYGGNLIVDNRPGASGRLAADFVKGGDADGQTILFPRARNDRRQVVKNGDRSWRHPVLPPTNE